MAGAELLTNAWKEWSLHVLVLLSLTLQVMLLILAQLRRHIDSGVLRALVWSAYMLADATAIYVLGHLSVTSSSPEHDLMALWAPFLLLHLGGQDNITAYAIEDKKLWLRHLQTLVVQMAAAAYVIYGFSTIIGDGRSLILPATMLVSLAGVAKYGERVWALRYDSCRPTEDYGDDPNYVGPSADSLEFLGSPAFTGRSDPEAFLLKAHLLIDFAKGFFRWGPLSDLVLYTTPASNLNIQEQEEVYKVVEMQVSLIHDLFYTKVEVMHTWYGFCIRILTLLATAVAFLLFNILVLSNDYRKLMNNGGYSKVDVIVTYVLFVGAIILDCTSLFRAMYSTWTCAVLIEWRRDRYGEPDEITRLRGVGLAVCTFLARVLVYLRRMVHAAEWRRRCSWSRSMGQQNLIRLCTRSRSSPCSRMARWMGVEDRWNTSAYSWSVPFSERVKQQLLKSIRLLERDSIEEIHGHIIAGENAGVDLQARPWGIGAIRRLRRGLEAADSLAWSVQYKVEESILIWHIATDVYLWWRKQDKEAKKHGGGDDADDLGLVEAAQAMSNYMLFLLAARPHMLPPDASRDPYVYACYDLTGLECSSAEDVLTLLARYAEALRGTTAGSNSNPGSDDEPEFPCEALRVNKTLRLGCRLGALLIGQQDTPAVGGDTHTLEMICLVWADMLCYVGHGCSAHSHVKQLSCGGELLTVAALLAKYVTSIQESS